LFSAFCTGKAARGHFVAIYRIQDGGDQSKIRNIRVAFSGFLSQIFQKNRKMRQMRWAARALHLSSCLDAPNWYKYMYLLILLYFSRDWWSSGSPFTDHLVGYVYCLSHEEER
jgi:hypothetical protein